MKDKTALVRHNISDTYHTPGWYAVLGYRLDGYGRSILHPGPCVDSPEAALS